MSTYMTTPDYSSPSSPHYVDKCEGCTYMYMSNCCTAMITADGLCSECKEHAESICEDCENYEYNNNNLKS